MKTETVATTSIPSSIGVGFLITLKLSMEIIEQPAAEIYFCNNCGSYSSANLVGQHSTKENPTFPMVQVKGLQHGEDYFVEASCVYAEGPLHKAHPFMLYGNSCYDGICWAKVDTVTKIATFSKLVVEYVQVAYMPDSLKLREYKKVDPFNQKFHHAANPEIIDTEKFRLCFRLFSNNRREPIGEPIVSNIIYHEANPRPLKIIKLSHEIAPRNKSITMILLCDKLDNNEQDNIAIKFYRGMPGESDYWEDYGKIMKFHKAVAIILETPVYSGRFEVDKKPTRTFIQMCNLANGECSNSLHFFFAPNLLGKNFGTNTITSSALSRTTPKVSRNGRLFSHPNRTMNLRHKISSRLRRLLILEYKNRIRNIHSSN